MRKLTLKEISKIKGSAFPIFHLIVKTYSFLIDQYINDYIDDLDNNSEIKILEYLVENILSNQKDVYNNTNFWSDTMIKLYENSLKK